MYKIVKPIVISLVLIGCVHRDSYSEVNSYTNGENYAESSCSNMVNVFNKTDYPFMTLVQKGYEEQARYAFVKERELNFSNVLDNLYIVNFKYIDKKCYDLNKILLKKDSNIQAVELKRFKEVINQKYRVKLKEQSINKLKINLVDGCQDFARTYFRSTINMTRNNLNSTSKRQYERCLHAQEKISNERR